MLGRRHEAVRRARCGTLTMAMAMALALAAGPGLAADARERDHASGELEYRINCASCHGLDAKGAGPMSDALAVQPPDLTNLAKRNDGVFPFMRVIETIEGRTDLLSHGPREMPVWGQRFREDMDGAAARARILDLTLYLRSVQAE